MLFSTVLVIIICCLVVKNRLITAKQITVSMVHVHLNKLTMCVIAMLVIREMTVLKISMNVLQTPVYTGPAWMETIHLLVGVT